MSYVLHESEGAGVVLVLVRGEYPYFRLLSEEMQFLAWILVSGAIILLCIFDYDASKHASQCLS